MLLSLSLLSSLFFGLFPWEDIFIVDGTQAVLGQIPYQVSLQLNGVHICGGVLIDTATVLTAAHCFDKYQPNLFKAVAGIIDLSQGIGETGQESDISDTVINSEYDSATYVNDIALMKLAAPFQVTSYVGSASLPQLNTTPTGTAVVSGWGRTGENDPMSLLLLDTQLIVMTEEQCQDIYGEDITESVFCAGSSPGQDQDSCQGDSGGPVMCNENGENVLCGLVSAGIGCGRENTPGMYTSVSFFIDWIGESTLKLFKSKSRTI